jgi:hypothetical protein
MNDMNDQVLTGSEDRHDFLALSDNVHMTRTDQKMPLYLTVYEFKKSAVGGYCDLVRYEKQLFHFCGILILNPALELAPVNLKSARRQIKCKVIGRSFLTDDASVNGSKDRR